MCHFNFNSAISFLLAAFMFASCGDASYVGVTSPSHVSNRGHRVTPKPILEIPTMIVKSEDARVVLDPSAIDDVADSAVMVAGMRQHELCFGRKRQQHSRCHASRARLA